MSTPGGGPAPVAPAPAAPAAAAVATAVAAGDGPEGDGRQGAGSGLFGRGLLYVVVWSLQLVVSTVISPVLAHLLGAGQFGAFSSAIAVNQVLVALALLGLDQSLVLLRARSGDDAQARGLVASGALVAVLVTAAALVTAPLWAAALGFGGATSLVVAATLWTAPAAVVQVALALLISQDRLRAFTAVSLVSAVGGQGVGLVLLLATGSRSADLYAWGGLAAVTTSALVGLAVVRPRWRGLADLATTRRAVRIGLPLMIGSLALFVLNAGDRLVIQRLLGSAEVGRYQIAYTVGFVGVLLVSMTSQAWAPRISAVRDETARWQLIALARDGLLRLMAPVVLGIALGAPVVLRIVAPAEYRPAGLLVVVVLVAAAGLPVVIASASGRALITLERTRAVALAAIGAAVVNVALNLLVVPVWGLAGSAAATAVAFGVQAALHRAALPCGTAWPRTSPRVLLLVTGATAVALLTVLLPQTGAWNAGRFAVAVLCVPWLVVALRRARGGPAPALPATAGGAA